MLISAELPLGTFCCVKVPDPFMFYVNGFFLGISLHSDKMDLSTVGAEHCTVYPLVR